MSLSKLPISLTDALQRRNNVSDKVEITMEILQNEDIVSSFLNDPQDIVRGYSHAILDTHLQKLVLVDKDNINMDKNTKYVQQKQKVNIPGIGIGISIIDRNDRISSVFNENSQCVVSDIPLNNICNIKPVSNFFSLVSKNSKSYTDQNVIGEQINGITNPTVQLSCKGSNAGDHIEHYGFSSLNLHHHGGTKVWFIKPSANFVPTVMKMAALSENMEFPEGIMGVCKLNLTHRDLQYNPSILGVDYQTVKQERGEIILVHPSSIHSIYNMKQNLAESRNILPKHPKYLHHISSSKVCSHTEELNGRPGGKFFRTLIKNLPIQDYIHHSDPNKSYKLELIRYLTKFKDMQQYLPDVLDQIKTSHVVPTVFNLLSPLQHRTVEIKKKRFMCQKCDYSSDFYSNLNRHSKKSHRCGAPKNKNEVKCKICHSKSHTNCRHKK